MRYPDFLAAKRADVPSYVDAEMYQGRLDQITDQQNQQRKGQMLKAPIDLYEGYANITDTNPIADAVRKFQNKGEGAAGVPQLPGGVSSGNVTAGPMSSAVDGATIPGGTTLPPSTPNVLPPAGSSAQAGPASQAANAGSQTGSKMAGFAKMGGPVAGGLLGAGVTAATGGSTADVLRSGAGGAASGALMTSAPALAAAGPPGWAGLAGLAALSLYGMLG